MKVFDQNVYKEIFEFNQYESIYKIQENDLVLDLGCSKGYLYFKSVLENKNIDYVGVDASIFNIQDFIENLSGDLNPILLNLAVDNKPKIIDFSCIYHMDSHQYVQSITFPNLLKLINKPIDFLKFDIEGFEKYIFENYDLFKSKVNKFVGEVHFRSNVFPIKEVYCLLNKLKQDPEIDLTIFSIDMFDITDFVLNIENYYTEILINGQVLK